MSVCTRKLFFGPDFGHFPGFLTDFCVIFRSKMVDFELGPECRPELFEVYLDILTRGTNGTGDQGGGPGGLGPMGPMGPRGPMGPGGPGGPRGALWGPRAPYGGRFGPYGALGPHSGGIWAL